MFWISVVVEFTWFCQKCSRIMNYGERAFMLVDAGQPIFLGGEKRSFTFEDILCPACMEDRYPDALKNVIEE